MKDPKWKFSKVTMKRHETWSIRKKHQQNNITVDTIYDSFMNYDYILIWEIEDFEIFASQETDFGSRFGATWPDNNLGIARMGLVGNG